MPESSPIRAGFLAVRGEPAVVLGEIAWRWTFGAAAIALSGASLMVYLNTLTVGRAELWALESMTPWLVIDAVVHILRGSGPQFVLMLTLVCVGLTMAWILVASLGRAATLAHLCIGRGEPTLAEIAPVGQPSLWMGHPAFGKVILLHVLRALFFWASTIAFVGATILADRAATAGSEPSFGVFAGVFLLLSIVISFAHSRVTWLAAVATIFVVRGHSVARGIERSVALYTRHPGQITRINTAFGLAHFVIFMVASFMSVSGLALYGQVPAALATAVVCIITLGYFAFADFLYIARMAAYVALIENDDSQPLPQPSAPEGLLPSRRLHSSHLRSSCHPLYALHCSFVLRR